MLKTKIVCTLGPSTDNLLTIEDMINSGMSVARFNFSHGSHSEHKQRIDLLRTASANVGKNIALMLDTKGPEIRLGSFYNRTTKLFAGEIFILKTEDIPGDSFVCSVSHKSLYKEVNPGDTILLADGLIKLVVNKIDGSDIVTIVQNDGEISSHKRVAVPGVHLGLPPLSEVDVADIRFGASEGMDYIAASFVQTANDVIAIRQIVENAGASMGIIAKIENAFGVQNIDEIITVSDGIMVARGDLGVEVPAEDVPLIQKKIIQKCNMAGKPVITATQMLETMIVNPRPTRAEVSDIANAVLDGADAVMLSGETASGKYPVEAVKVMATVAWKTEASMTSNNKDHSLVELEQLTDEAVCSAAVDVINRINGDAIITITKCGNIARRMSKLRPRAPIIAITPSESIARRLQLLWGVRPMLKEGLISQEVDFQDVIKATLATGMIKYGNVIVAVRSATDSYGSAVMMRVHTVADVIAKGNGVGTKVIQGKVRKVYHLDDIKSLTEDQILCVTGVDEQISIHACKAKGIICEEGGLSSAAVIVGINCGIPVIVAANGIMDKLDDLDEVTMDTSSGIVYRGKVNLSKTDAC